MQIDIHRNATQTESLLARTEARQAFGRLIYPKDVAALMAWLMSDDAQMMTGALIDFDQNVAGTYD